MFRQNQDMIRSNYICKSYDKSDKCEFEKQEINKEAKTDFSSESQIIKTEKSRSIVENESQVNSETDKISQETIKENFPFPTFLKSGFFIAASNEPARGPIISSFLLFPSIISVVSIPI